MARIGQTEVWDGPEGQFAMGKARVLYEPAAIPVILSDSLDFLVPIPFSPLKEIQGKLAFGIAVLGSCRNWTSRQANALSLMCMPVNAHERQAPVGRGSF